MEERRTNLRMRRIINTALAGMPTLAAKEAFLMGLRFGIEVLKETEPDFLYDEALEIESAEQARREGLASQWQ